MTEWFRSWHGAPTDNKWLVIARRAETLMKRNETYEPIYPGFVSAVVWALLDHASQAEARGDVSGFDVETYAAFSGFSEDAVSAIIAALKEKEVISSDQRLKSWDKRQPKREDNNSTARVRAFRERMKRDETHGNIVQLNGTLEQSREEQSREEQKGSFSDKLIFPKDGSIEYTRWAGIVRMNAPGKDVDYVASDFRKFCLGRGIEFHAPSIEKTFTTFCHKHSKRSANA